MQYGKYFQKKYTKTFNIYADRGDYSAIWVIGAFAAVTPQWNCFAAADCWLDTLLFFRPARGQCGNIGLPWQEVVPATHLHCMVPFLHAIMLGMGNLDNFDFYINIR